MRASQTRLALAMACLGFLADQASKYGMFRGLYDGALRGELEVVPGWFRFTTEYAPERPFTTRFYAPLQSANGPVMPHVNYGALFGLGGQHKELANYVFAGISAAAAVGILVWLIRGRGYLDRWLSVALGCILGGTLGNFYDRLVFYGVRDFLYFYKIEWPVFNIADCSLVVGAAMLLLHALFVSPASDTPTETATKTGTNNTLQTPTTESSTPSVTHPIPADRHPTP